jgi:mRNA interferase RelE/StbE
MAYRLELTSEAINDLRRIDRTQAQRIMKKLFQLAKNAEIVSHYALKEPFKGLYRIRIGDYRAQYALDHKEQVLIVEGIGHRRDVYDE